MSYVAKIMPDVPAELDEILENMGCNWAIPQGLMIRSDTNIIEYFGTCGDVYVAVDTTNIGISWVVTDGASAPMGTADALWLLAESDAARVADELGDPVYEHLRRFGYGVNHVIADFPDSYRERMQDELLSLFKII